MLGRLTGMAHLPLRWNGPWEDGAAQWRTRAPPWPPQARLARGNAPDVRWEGNYVIAPAGGRTMRRGGQGGTPSTSTALAAKHPPASAHGRSPQASQRRRWVTAVGMAGILLCLLVACKAVGTLVATGGERQLQTVLFPSPSVPLIFD